MAAGTSAAHILLKNATFSAVLYQKMAQKNLSIYGQNFLQLFGSSVSVLSINFWRILECEPKKKLLLGVILSVFWEKSASGWGNVKNSKGSFLTFPW